MFKKLILLTLCVLALVAETQVADPIDCFRMKDSSYGHFLTCSATKPLPLKVETTFVLDKDYAWNLFSYDVALYDGVEKKTTSLSKCIQGTPGPGNKTAGTNLTLATTCNTLPRELRQYDMIRYEVHFPNSEWLIWAVPIPGYTTSEDVEKFIEQQEFNIPQINVPEVFNEHTEKERKFFSHLRMIKNLRKNKL